MTYTAEAIYQSLKDENRALRERYTALVRQLADIEAMRPRTIIIQSDAALLRQALDFCEFAWRDVPMNEYAFERLEQVIAAISRRLGETK